MTETSEHFCKSFWIKASVKCLNVNVTFHTLLVLKENTISLCTENRPLMSIITFYWLADITGSKSQVLPATLWGSQVSLVLIQGGRWKSVTSSLDYAFKMVDNSQMSQALGNNSCVSSSTKTFVLHTSSFPSVFSVWSSLAAVWSLGTKRDAFSF